MEYLDSLIIIEVEIFARGNLYQITINLFGISDTSHIVYRHISSIKIQISRKKEKKRKYIKFIYIKFVMCRAVNTKAIFYIC